MWILKDEATLIVHNNFLFRRKLTSSVSVHPTPYVTLASTVTIWNINKTVITIQTGLSICVLRGNARTWEYFFFHLNLHVNQGLTFFPSQLFFDPSRTLDNLMLINVRKADFSTLGKKGLWKLRNSFQFITPSTWYHIRCVDINYFPILIVDVSEWVACDAQFRRMITMLLFSHRQIVSSRRADRKVWENNQGGC